MSSEIMHTILAYMLIPSRASIQVRSRSNIGNRTQSTRTHFVPQYIRTATSPTCGFSFLSYTVPVALAVSTLSIWMRHTF